MVTCVPYVISVCHDSFHVSESMSPSQFECVIVYMKRGAISVEFFYFKLQFVDLELFDECEMKFSLSLNTVKRRWSY